MQDRVPTYAGRVKLTQVSGDIYDMEMADEPIAEGTALNKANILTDETAALFGLGNTAVPNDVFKELGTMPYKKLFSLELSGNQEQIVFDFSDIDMTKFAEIKIISSARGGTCSLTINGDATQTYYSKGFSTSSTFKSALFDFVLGANSAEIITLYRAQHPTYPCVQATDIRVGVSYAGAGRPISGVTSGLNYGLYRGKTFDEITSIKFSATSATDPIEAGTKITIYGGTK